jgi:hypothetical protein
MTVFAVRRRGMGNRHYCLMVFAGASGKRGRRRIIIRCEVLMVFAYRRKRYSTRIVRGGD